MELTFFIRCRKMYHTLQLPSLKTLEDLFVLLKSADVFIAMYQGLLYHRTCKPNFLCSWPSLNSYLK